MSKKWFPVAAVVGAVAGVVAGVLTAPKSGKETRADLKERADELKTKATQKVDDAKLKADQLKDKSKGAVEDAKKNLKR